MSDVRGGPSEREAGETRRSVTTSDADCAKAAEVAGEHQHEWMNWVRPAVLRDSLGAVVGQAGIALRHLSGTDDPVLPGWWRTCRSCPAEEWSALAAERAAAVADLRARVLALADEWEGYAREDPSWEITVLVPIEAGDEAFQRIFDAVADAAHDAQPSDRDWDVFVSSVQGGHVQVPEHLLRAAVTDTTGGTQ